jgi:hypothetical protein
MAAFAVLRFASPEGPYAAMARLESLPGKEQPLQGAEVVSGRCRERSALGSHQDIGISGSFIRDVRDKITPGTSALLSSRRTTRHSAGRPMSSVTGCGQAEDVAAGAALGDARQRPGAAGQETPGSSSLRTGHSFWKYIASFRLPR